MGGLTMQKEYSLDNTLEESKAPQSIAIMLDSHGTSDMITETSAEILINLIDTLRKQFGGQKAYICISSHNQKSEQIKKILDELAKFTNEDILLGPSFFYGGRYDYNTNTEYNMGAFFNSNKIKTFQEYYLKNAEFNIGWIALIDDSISYNTHKCYKDYLPMVAIKPSQKSYNPYANFMHRESVIDNIFGVNELLEEYIKDIKGMSLANILAKQRELVSHLSEFEIQTLIKKRDFKTLYEYLQSEVSDEDIFKNIYELLVKENLEEPFELADKLYIDETFNLLKNRASFKEKIIEAKSLAYKTK